MMRALGILESVCLAAFLIGVYVWALIAFFWLRTGEAFLFEASVAVAGAALCAGAWGVVSWCARAIIRTERNMREVLDRLPSLAADNSYVDDQSEAATIEAMRRAQHKYETTLMPLAAIRADVVGDLQKGGAL